MISEDSLLKTFVNEEARIGTAGANLLDRVFLGQLYFSFRETTDVGPRRSSNQTAVSKTLTATKHSSSLSQHRCRARVCRQSNEVLP
jgi:hypothetical protein